MTKTRTTTVSPRVVAWRAEELGGEKSDVLEVNDGRGGNRVERYPRRKTAVGSVMDNGELN